ncbi:hypothetical protein BC829DRAFT_422631 [Chytridium lagenaria]|nr:hypothetical protein BC829DRAFT_422631 [Chytridium lagenaria]
MTVMMGLGFSFSGYRRATMEDCAFEHVEEEEPCGSWLEVHNLVRFKATMIRREDDGKDEFAIKAVLIQQGHETCTIGFVPRAFLHQRDLYVNKFAQVVELLVQSPNAQVRRYSYQNGGVAIALLLDQISGL